METLLTVAGAALGVLVPALLFLALRRGIERSPFEPAQKRRYTQIAFVSIASWTALVWVASLAGWIAYHEGDAFPRFLLPLSVPVVAGAALAASETFRRILDHTPVSTLVGVQTFRLAGGAFLLIVHLGILPGAFATAGYGDLTTGLLAVTAAVALSRKRAAGGFLFWAFNASGLADLLNVAFLLLRFYPAYSDAVPSSAPAFEFSLVMIPALAAPIALLLHLYAIRNSLASTALARSRTGQWKAAPAS
jgi:hypothetical protein